MNIFRRVLPIILLLCVAFPSYASSGVQSSFSYTPAPYTVLNGTAAYPYQLVSEILKRQELGHLSYRVHTPAVSYRIRPRTGSAGVYELYPEDVTVTGPARVVVTFSVKYPVLSHTQFAFVRSATDYRLVYGLIRGIVGHELMHYRALRAYTHAVQSILSSPLTKPITVVAGSDGEFSQKAQRAITTAVAKRLAAVRTAHERAQAAVDDERKGPAISFVFENEVNGEVPPPLVATFHGIANFSFQLPPGPIPRPVTPKI